MASLRMKTSISTALISLTVLARALSGTFSQWLGQISFGLYLVHVPLLYTVVAWERVTLELPVVVLVIAFGILTLALAQLFSVAIDAPTLRLLKRAREWFAFRQAGQQSPTTHMATKTSLQTSSILSDGRDGKGNDAHGR